MQQRMKEEHEWSAADTETSLRIVAAIILAFLPWGTIRFMIVYTFAGLTDVLDGWLARKNQTASEFGARLDSIADLLFYGVLLIRMLPLLYQMFPEEIWYFVLGIIVVRLVSYAVAAVKFRRFASLHTWLNKLTGVAVFLLPYMLQFTYGNIYCWAVCIFAFAAGVEELVIHLLWAEYAADRKSVFWN